MFNLNRIKILPYFIQGRAIIFLLVFLSGVVSAEVSRVKNINSESAINENEVGCVQWGPIDLCEPLSVPQESLVWRAFDANNEVRQNKVYHKMIDAAGWRHGEVAAAPFDSAISIAWNMKVRQAMDSSMLGMPVQVLRDILLDEEIYELIGKNIKPAIRIYLKSKKIQIYRNEAKKWIYLTTDTEVGRSFCEYEKLNNKDSCFLEIYKQIFPSNIESQIQFFIEDDQIKMMANYIHNMIKFHEHNKSYSNKYLRRVYIFQQDGSPRIDVLGNLYINKKYLQKKNYNNLDVILSHESVHVNQLFQHQTAALLQELQTAKFFPKSQDELMEKIQMIIKHPDEAIIDLMAIEIFSMNKDAIKLYAELLKNTEGSDTNRVKMLEILGEIKSRISLKQIIYRMDQVISIVCVINPAIKSITHAAYRIDTDLK